MKRNIYLFVLFFVCSFTALQAQHGPMNRQQFRERQQQFIIERAKLTPQEADKFFPLYFELQDKKHELNKSVWSLMRNKPQEELSDKEYEKLINNIIETRIASDKLDLEYTKKYEKILPAKKIYRIMRSEMTFHRDLLKCFNKENRRGKRVQHRSN